MWRLLYQAALGLDYLHKKNVVHGDLKLNNILVGADGQAKLSDFGLSAVRTSSTLSRTSGSDQSVMGGLRWRAPECLKQRPSFASDIYSFAMCMIEAVINEPPFAFLDDDDVRANLQNGTIPDRPAEMNDGAWQLVLTMTHFDPNKRVKLSTVLEQLKLLAGNEAGRTCCSSMGSDQAQTCSKCERTPTIDFIPDHFEKTGQVSRTDLVSDLLCAAYKSADPEQPLQLVLGKFAGDDFAPTHSVNGMEILKSFVKTGRTYFAQV